MKSDKSLVLSFSLLISKPNKRPRYLKDSPFLSEGTVYILMKNFGWN